MHYDCRQVVEAGSRVGAPGLVQVVQQVRRHVQSLQRELHVGVDLGAGEDCPPEPLDVQAEDVGEPPDPKLLGGGLLPSAPVAEEALRLPKLLHVGELGQAVCGRNVCGDNVMNKNRLSSTTCGENFQRTD